MRTPRDFLFRMFLGRRLFLLDELNHALPLAASSDNYHPCWFFTWSDNHRARVPSCPLSMWALSKMGHFSFWGIDDEVPTWHHLRGYSAASYFFAFTDEESHSAFGPGPCNDSWFTRLETIRSLCVDTPIHTLAPLIKDAFAFNLEHCYAPHM